MTLTVLLAQAGLACAVPASRSTQHTVTKRAPNGPPLSTITPPTETESNAGVPSGAGDPLVENGLSSPLCKSSTGLSSAAQSNCQTSGFVGAPAPTGNYALDVNINVGPLGLSKGGLLSVIQDVFITPLWNGLVWIVHALVVMLEWCYTLELLGGSTMSAIASSLRSAQASFTEPWLALVLAVASVLAVYNGLVRRRVSETLGQTLVTIAMMALGLWVIADPLGSIGAVGQWANQASLGTLGAVVQGTPANAQRTLADSMRALFTGAIEMPWCYLEFGNVRWCSEPSLLDSHLHKTALNIAAGQQRKLNCQPSPDHPLCPFTGNTSTLAIERTDELLREADTNGKLFLAFSANRAERNSVKEEKSLLHVLCQAEEDTNCTGPTAAQAEFRSDSGTFPRMIGVILIAVGVLGMVMLCGLIALHLFAASVMGLFMLLLAPFAVLAPALGDGGRAVFGGWLTRLLGAVTSKLLFSFLLGALLTMQRILMSLQSLGWWTEWLLISAFWWTVFLKRHQAQSFLRGRAREPIARSRKPVGRGLQSAREVQRAVRHPVQWAKGKILSPVPSTERLDKRDPGGRDSKRKPVKEQKSRRPKPPPVARPQTKPQADARRFAKRAQLERVRTARKLAVAAGDRRRVAKLSVRSRRIEAELAGEPGLRDRKRPAVAGGEGFQYPNGRQHGSFTQIEPDSKQADYVSIPRLARVRQSQSQSDPRSGRPVGQRTHPDGRASSGPSPTRSVSDAQTRDPQGIRERRSAVMDDARAVAERRKRQLGYGPTQ